MKLFDEDRAINWIYMPCKKVSKGITHISHNDGYRLIIIYQFLVRFSSFPALYLFSAGHSPALQHSYNTKSLKI